jgi:hypothetical protein
MAQACAMFVAFFHELKAAGVPVMPGSGAEHGCMA